MLNLICARLAFAILRVSVCVFVVLAPTGGVGTTATNIQNIYPEDGAATDCLDHPPCLFFCAVCLYFMTFGLLPLYTNGLHSTTGKLRLYNKIKNILCNEN